MMIEDGMEELSAIDSDQTPTGDWPLDFANNNPTNSTLLNQLQSPNGNSTSMTASEPPLASSALECARKLTSNMPKSTIEEEEEIEEREAQLLQTDLDDLDAATARLLSFSDPDSDQESHSSSLESEEHCSKFSHELYKRNSGLSEEDGDSTSCSVDSFELSTLSESQDREKLKLPTINGQLGSVEEESDSTTPSTSTLSKGKLSLSEVRQSIHEELSQLDTAMPQLDFDHLEKQLTTAAKERELNQRKLMSEEVRRRLASDSDDPPTCYPPAPTTRPLKSNLGHRLKSGMNMQICFMNDGLPGDESSSEDGEFGDSFDDDQQPCSSQFVPKSRSTPNLSAKRRNQISRSASTADDSSKKASDLRSEKNRLEPLNSDKLEAETRLMLVKAKQAAHMQMEVERQGNGVKSVVEDIVGIPLSRKLSRLKLSKMGLTRLQLIVNDLHTKIEKMNIELVELLIERDSLHMEQDSMLVDVEDMLQHQRCVDLKLPAFLVRTVEPATNNNSSTRFRIFKR